MNVEQIKCEAIVSVNRLQALKVQYDVGGADDGQEKEHANKAMLRKLEVLENLQTGLFGLIDGIADISDAPAKLKSVAAMYNPILHQLQNISTQTRMYNATNQRANALTQQHQAKTLEKLQTLCVKLVRPHIAMFFDYSYYKGVDRHTRSQVLEFLCSVITLAQQLGLVSPAPIYTLLYPLYHPIRAMILKMLFLNNTHVFSGVKFQLIAEQFKNILADMSDYAPIRHCLSKLNQGLLSGIIVCLALEELSGDRDDLQDIAYPLHMSGVVMDKFSIVDVLDSISEMNDFIIDIDNKTLTFAINGLSKDGKLAPNTNYILPHYRTLLSLETKSVSSRKLNNWFVVALFRHLVDTVPNRAHLTSYVDLFPERYKREIWAVIE